MGNRQILTFALIGLLLVTALNAMFRVDRRERVVLRQFGEIRGTDFTPGLHFKLPFLQTVLKFDGRMQTLDNQTETFLTQDKKSVKVDFFVKWQIGDVGDYYRATGGDDTVAADRLSAIVNRVLRDEFAGRTVPQAVSGEGGDLTRGMAAAAKTDIASLGIDVVDVRVKRIDFPDEVRDKVYERMRADRTRAATELRAKGAEEAERIRAEADREAQVILAAAYSEAERTRGDGDAKAAEIYAKAYGQDPEFYRFYRSLRAYRESMSGRGDILVLQPDSEFFRYFKSPGGAGK
jgi:membrane protease subunit HflC